MNLKRRTSTNKTPRICLAFLIVFGIYYIVAHTNQVISPKFMDDLESMHTLPPKINNGCPNLGCTEFPIHHNVLHKLPPELSKKAIEMCDKTFWHTLSTTIKNTDHNDFFVFTGDIPHMWLRDSAAQVHGYISLAKEDVNLRKLLSGVINRSAFYINHDPYGNAFSLTYEAVRSQYNCEGCYGHVAEWKYELDSTCYFLRLIYTYWHTLGEDSLSILKSAPIVNAVKLILEMWKVEQNHYNNSQLEGYFNPATNQSLYKNRGYNNEARGDGRGNPVQYTGMIWSGFRPSDDACLYGYLVPSNMFASSVLSYVKLMAKDLWEDEDLLEKATKMKEEVDEGIAKYAIVKEDQLVKKYGYLYAYEVDGLGNYILMDDANVPSLLSLPYILGNGYKYAEDIYRNTRRFLLSTDNTNYFESADKKYKGIGSLAHTGPGAIWPMSQLIQGLTTRDPAEKLELLHQLLTSDANTGWMHESYQVNNPNQFTRKWFCWADALFAEFVMSMTEKDCRGVRPHVEGLNI